MTAVDVRGLTPLIWGMSIPYGVFDLDMGRRLDLEAVEVAWQTDLRNGEEYG